MGKQSTSGNLTPLWHRFTTLLSVPLIAVQAIQVSALAVPQSMRDVHPGTTSMPLLRRAPLSRTKHEWGEWAYKHRQGLSQKYGRERKSRAKRSTGSNMVVNQGGDSSYYGSLAIGTPAVSYNVILDTGSSDLWVADSNCLVGCVAIPTFNPTSSNTYRNLSYPFEIVYGSGQAAGTLAQDIVQMAGFSVPNQVFATCDQVSSGLLQSPVSGLMGLAFETIASSRATPFWQTLVSGGAWDEPVMAFHLTRYNNATNLQRLEPGGSFDMGFTNSSLYTGDIDYVNLPSAGTYWVLPLTKLNVNGNSVSLPSGSSSYAAIDTGTTLVGGPREAIANIFSQIPGSQPGSGNFEGYYTYPCDTSVTVELGFGNSGRMWSISPADFRLSELDQGECLGAFFELSGGGSAPPWIVGDTFLKNVYSVFRYQPASVGFAQLSSTATGQNGAGGPIPSPTIGSAAATVSATAMAQVSSSGSTRLAVLECVWRTVVLVWAIALALGMVV